MSWHYSQEQGGGFSADTYLAGLRSAQWKLRSTPESACCNDSAMDSSLHSPSGTMLPPSTVNLGADSSMSSAAASPAKISPVQEKAKESPVPARASGKRCTESFAKYDPDSHSWKTPHSLPLGDSTSYSGTWPRQGMMLRGSCSPLPTSVLPTNAKESGFLQLIPTPTCRGLDGGAHSRARLKALNFFPTPTCQDAKNNGSPSQQARNTKPLNVVVGGALNPVWVEWLMGWPLGWTDSKPLATDKFHSWQRKHSQSLKTY